MLSPDYCLRGRGREQGVQLEALSRQTGKWECCLGPEGPPGRGWQSVRFLGFLKTEQTGCLGDIASLYVSTQKALRRPAVNKPIPFPLSFANSVASEFFQKNRQPLFCGTRVAQTVFGNAVIETKTDANPSTADCSPHKSVLRLMRRTLHQSWVASAAARSQDVTVCSLLMLVILARPKGAEDISSYSVFQKYSFLFIEGRRNQ